MQALYAFVNRVPPVYSLLIWIGLWELVGRLDLAFILPPFSSVIEQLVILVQRADFQRAALVTLQSFVYGMTIAIIGGVALGFLMGRNKMANGVLGMWVNIFASAPLSSLVPILMLLFGAKKLPDLAKGLGSGIRNFKGELKAPEEDTSKQDEIEPRA